MLNIYIYINLYIKSLYIIKTSFILIHLKEEISKQT